MSESEKQLREARESLLDLTLRNPLINFRPTARRTIQVIDETPKEVFDRLVLQERKMQFKPMPANQADDGKTSQTELKVDGGELSDESVDSCINYAVCKNELKCKVNFYDWYDLSFLTFLYGNG